MKKGDIVCKKLSMGTNGENHLVGPYLYVTEVQGTSVMCSMSKTNTKLLFCLRKKTLQKINVLHLQLSVKNIKTLLSGNSIREIISAQTTNIFNEKYKVVHVFNPIHKINKYFLNPQILRIGLSMDTCVGIKFFAGYKLTVENEILL